MHADPQVDSLQIPVKGHLAVLGGLQISATTGARAL